MSLGSTHLHFLPLCSDISGELQCVRQNRNLWCWAPMQPSVRSWGELRCPLDYSRCRFLILYLNICLSSSFLHCIVYPLPYLSPRRERVSPPGLLVRVDKTDSPSDACYLLISCGIDRLLFAFCFLLVYIFSFFISFFPHLWNSTPSLCAAGENPLVDYWPAS